MGTSERGPEMISFPAHISQNSINGIDKQTGEPYVAAVSGNSWVTCFTQTQLTVLNTITNGKLSKKDIGYDRMSLVAETGICDEKIVAALNHLEVEGYVYTTCDEHHWKSVMPEWLVVT